MTDRIQERRALRGRVETRGSSDGSMLIGGYAAKFATRSQNLGGYVETIGSAFFNKSAADGWPGVMARYNHEDDWLLGTTAGETLTLSLDDVGLDYEVRLPSFRADIFELVERGDVSRSSFAFYTFEDDWTLDDNGFPMRTLISGQLVDVAPVNTPAYTDTSTGLRSLAELRGVDVSDVARLANAGELATIINAAPVVIDLGARSTEAPAPPAQAPATQTGRVEKLRQLLDKKAAPPL